VPHRQNAMKIARRYPPGRLRLSANTDGYATLYCGTIRAEIMVE
jgi:hypothetical protein